MATNEIELEVQLKEAGNELLNPPSSTDDLLNLLDVTTLLLSFFSNCLYLCLCLLGFLLVSLYG